MTAVPSEKEEGNPVFRVIILVIPMVTKHTENMKKNDFLVKSAINNYLKYLVDNTCTIICFHFSHFPGLRSLWRSRHFSLFTPQHHLLDDGIERDVSFYQQNQQVVDKVGRFVDDFRIFLVL